MARKETKAAIAPLRKIVTALRRRVAQQKRVIEELERSAKRTTAAGKLTTAAAGTAGPQIRFSPNWVRTHRKKLKMSRRIYAKLVGVSAQSIFGWEAGRTRPRRSALAAWRRLRAMGAREVKALLDSGKPGRRWKPVRRGKSARRGLRRGKKK